MPIAIVPVQKQTNGYNFGLLTIAFAMDILNGLATVDSWFDVILLKTMLCYKWKDLPVQRVK